MRTTVDIDRHLLKRLRDEAHRQGVSFKALLHRVLRRGLDGPPPEDEAPYTCPTFALRAPRRPLDKALALADAVEEEELARKLAMRK